jgi:hypothetical protein
MSRHLALSAEKHYLQRCLRHCFGYHLLALSDELSLSDLATSTIPHKIIAHRRLKHNSPLVIDSCDLPLANDSVDVLISHGQAILLGLTLHRFFSVRRYTQSQRRPHAFSLNELKGLLADASLAIEDIQCLEPEPVGVLASLRRLCQKKAAYAVRVRKKTLAMLPLSPITQVYELPCTNNSSFKRLLAPKRKPSAVGQCSPKITVANNQ